MDNFLAYIMFGLGLAAAAWAAYVKWGEYQDADAPTRLQMIGSLVAAAEQMLGKQDGQTRLEWVTEMIEKRFPDMDAEDIRIHIEAAVYWLKQGQAQPETSETDTAAAIPFWDESRSN